MSRAALHLLNMLRSGRGWDAGHGFTMRLRPIATCLACSAMEPKCGKVQPFEPSRQHAAILSVKGEGYSYLWGFSSFSQTTDSQKKAWEVFASDGMSVHSTWAPHGNVEVTASRPLLKQHRWELGCCVEEGSQLPRAEEGFWSPWDRGSPGSYFLTLIPDAALQPGLLSCPWVPFWKFYQTSQVERHTSKCSQVPERACRDQGAQEA